MRMPVQGGRHLVSLQQFTACAGHPRKLIRLWRGTKGGGRVLTARHAAQALQQTETSLESVEVKPQFGRQRGHRFAFTGGPQHIKKADVIRRHGQRHQGAILAETIEQCLHKPSPRLTAAWAQHAFCFFSFKSWRAKPAMQPTARLYKIGHYRPDSKEMNADAEYPDRELENARQAFTAAAMPGES